MGVLFVHWAQSPGEDYTVAGWMGSFHYAPGSQYPLESAPVERYKGTAFRCNLYWRRTAVEWSGVTAT